MYKNLKIAISIKDLVECEIAKNLMGEIASQIMKVKRVE